MRWSNAVLVLAGSMGIGLSWIGCGGEDSAPRLPPTGTVPTSTVTPTDCAEPAEGCACKKPGEVASCKKIRKSGDYISCSIGTITCGTDGRFGPCIADSISTLPPKEAGPSDAMPPDAPDAD